MLLGANVCRAQTDTEIQTPPPGFQLPGAPDDFGPPLPPQAKISTAAESATLQALRDQLTKGAIPADARNKALLLLKLEQAQLALDDVNSGLIYDGASVLRWVRFTLERAQTVARAKGDAVYPALEPMHERAYIAANDGSAQPYWVMLPKDYSPRNSYPLVVFLHGYTPDTTKINPWLPDETTYELATQRGFIFVVPYGRRNTDFVDSGEDDTLQVLAEVQKLYSVDASRIALLGPSMGGFGVYAIGLHHPDIWSGLAPMSARSDFYLWFNLQRDNVPPWKRLQYDADEPRFLATNGRHLPLFFQHGAEDSIVSVEQSRHMAQTLTALQIPFRYREIPLADHYIYVYNGAYEAALDWLKPLRRITAPNPVSYLSGNARNDGAYWLKIGARSDYSRAAKLEAQILPANNAPATIEVKLDNVTQFTLSPPATLLAADAPFELKINGATATATRDAQNHIVWRDATQIESTTWPQSKTPARCGPLKNAFRDRFLLVYGTQTLPNNRFNPDEMLARRWQKQWQIYADGLPPIKADKDVTANDKRDFNLVLFGSHDSNSVLGEIAAKLPLEWTPTGVRVGDKTVAGENLGLQLCYASPWSREHLIVVQSGAPWGDFLPDNHKWDLLPDYIVFTPQRATDDTNVTLEAGFFDHNWQLAPATVATP